MFSLAQLPAKWNLTTMDGIHWLIQNVKSGRYLGVPLDANVQNRLAVQEVDHKVGWKVQEYGDLQKVFQYVSPNPRLQIAVMNASKALHPVYEA
jgi:hypothetical protein